MFIKKLEERSIYYSLFHSNIFVYRSGSSNSSGITPKRSSSRLRDPDLAEKRKAFMQKVSVACGSSSMDSYLKQQEVEGSIQEINLATAAADKATAALVGSKSPNVAENTMTTTAVPTVPKLTLKRKAPGTDSATANPLNSDAEVRKVLSSYGAVQSHSNANSMGSNTGLSPAAKRRRSGRTSGSNTTVCKIKVSTQKTNIKV